jgi:RimJ/RimL family protein N-acetyltransferase
MHDQPAHAPTLATAGGDWYGDHRLPTLYSPRLRLRWLDNDDLGALYRMFSDREALRWWNHPPLASADDASIYLEGVHRGHRQGDLLQWGFERLDTHGIIGTALLAGVDPMHGRAEMRLLLKSRFWGHGYGREAARALLAYAFNDLGLRRIEAEATPGNRPSLKALEAVGFKREGYLRQRWLIGGEPQDSILLALLASEFATNDA